MKLNSTSNQIDRNMLMSLRTLALALVFAGLFQPLLNAQGEYSTDDYLKDFLVVGHFSSTNINEPVFGPEVNEGDPIPKEGGRLISEAGGGLN